MTINQISIVELSIKVVSRRKHYEGDTMSKILNNNNQRSEHFSVSTRQAEPNTLAY